MNKGILLLIALVVCSIGVFAIAPLCKDSDGGFNPYTKGTLTYNGKTYTDSCRFSNVLTEYFCPFYFGCKSLPIQMEYMCKCVNGACVKPICTTTKSNYEDVLNVGNLVSEIGHNLLDWGPIQPETSGGNWGESTDANCVQQKAYDGSLRVVSDVTSSDEATFKMNFGGTTSSYSDVTMELAVLKGLSTDDSFDVYVEGVLVYSFIDDGTRNPYCNNEEWVKHTIPHLQKGGIKTIKIVSTANHWGGYETYGQVAVSKVTTRWTKDTTICK